MFRTLSFVEKKPLLEIDNRAYGLWHYRLSWTQTGVPGVPSFYAVTGGESLSSIAGKFLGDFRRWPEILRLNRTLASNPEEIVTPGQQLVLPTGPALESQVALSFASQIGIRDPSDFPSVTQLSRMRPVATKDDNLQYVISVLPNASWPEPVLRRRFLDRLLHQRGPYRALVAFEVARATPPTGGCTLRAFQFHETNVV